MEEDTIPKTKKPLSDKLRIGHMEVQLNTINNILWAAVIIMLIMVAQMLMESWRTKSDTYQSIVEKVNMLVEQNKIKAEDEKTIKINELEQQIKDIKTKNPYLK